MAKYETHETYKKVSILKRASLLKTNPNTESVTGHRKKSSEKVKNSTSPHRMFTGALQLCAFTTHTVSCNTYEKIGYMKV